LTKGESGQKLPHRLPALIRLGSQRASLTIRLQLGIIRLGGQPCVGIHRHVHTTAWREAISVQVHADIPQYGVSIKGELDSTIRPDGDEFIALIPALHLFTQGHTEQQATARLERLFVEFCEVAVEQNRLLEILRSRGFNIIPAGEKVRSPQYLLINIDRQHKRDDDQEDRVAELAGAEH